MNNPLVRLGDFGQSVWLDYIRRNFIQSGELKKMIDEDGLKGVTSNPSIFEEAIGHSDDYNEAIEHLSAGGKKSTEAIFLSLAVEDVGSAADVFTPVYQSTKGLDGYVSLELSPALALNTEGSITEGRLSWAALNRPNVMIKVPGTKEGAPAIKQLISEGININVTLLFSLENYRKVAEAYIEGLEERVNRGETINKIFSVASFFLSRIDTMADPMLDEIIQKGGDHAGVAGSLKGKLAVASAKLAYEIYEELFKGSRFHELELKGANPQRLLWASTSTKNKAYSDVKYVEALIGKETVNTMPMETLKAYRDHGNPADRIHDDMEDAHKTIEYFEKIGISVREVTKKLEEEGIQKFIKPFESLMHTLKEKTEKLNK